MPPKSLVVKTKSRLRLAARVALAWTVWFLAKVLLDRFWLHQDVFGDISQRLSVAVKSSTNTVLAFYAFFRSVLLALLHWSDVLLPFVQDSWFLLKEYVEPFVRTRLIVPLSTFLAPVPIFVWGYSKIAWTWFHNTIPLEYRLALIFTGILLWNRRIDAFLKTQIVACMILLFAFRFVSPLLLYVRFMLVTFIGIPAVIGLHAVITNVEKSSRLSNLLLYFSILPMGVFAEWKLGISGLPAIGLLSVSIAYSFVGSWLYWIDQDLFSRDFRTLIDNTGFLPRVKPALVRCYQFIEARIPFVSEARLKLESLRNSLSLNSVALNALSSNNVGLLAKVLAIIKSTPVITLMITLIMIVLAVLYWIHAAMSKIFMFGLYPWWFLETVKVCLYQRKEDYQRQLAFSLLFLALESFLLVHGDGFVSFVLNMFHIPVIIAIRVFPVLILQLVSKSILFVPISLIKLASSRKVMQPAHNQELTDAGSSEAIVPTKPEVEMVIESPVVNSETVSVRKRKSSTGSKSKIIS